MAAQRHQHRHHCTLTLAEYMCLGRSDKPRAESIWDPRAVSWLGAGSALPCTGPREVEKSLHKSQDKET